MKDINGLLVSLNGYLQWNKSRISCFSVMLLGLFAVKVVNLQEIALAFQSTAKVSSRYRRLQRFFAEFDIDYTKIARWVFGLIFKNSEKVYLAGSRSERDELMIVATNQVTKNAISTYLRGWEIESLFQSMKSRDFRFEETH